MFISKLYWNYIDEKYCDKEEFKLCFNHLQRSRFFGYIKVAWQPYNYKLQRGLESTSLLFSRSVSVNNIYPTTSVKHDILAATFLYLGKFLSYQQKLMFVWLSDYL